jgi:carboxymethylenebutenolidase
MVKRLTSALAGLTLAACGSTEPPAPAAAGPAASADRPVASAAPEPAAASAAEAERPPAVDVAEQDLAYGEGDHDNLLGFLALPREAAEPLPGLILIHEEWGLDEEVKDVARRLAAEGYIVLAVDLFAGEVTQEPAVARTLQARTARNPGDVRANLRQAYQYLDKYALAPRIGCIGFGPGGRWSLECAALMPGELDAVVTTDGPVPDDIDGLAKLEVPLLGLFAALDPYSPFGKAQALRERLRELDKDARIIIYLKAGHAFTRRSARGYDAEAAADAWKSTMEFLEANLKR